MTRIVPTGIDRRTLLRSSQRRAALATALQCRLSHRPPDKARLRQPADRPARGIRRSRQLHHCEFQEASKGGIKLGSVPFQWKSLSRTAVESQPRRSSRKGFDSPGQRSN